MFENRRRKDQKKPKRGGSNTEKKSDSEKALRLLRKNGNNWGNEGHIERRERNTQKDGPTRESSAETPI